MEELNDTQQKILEFIKENKSASYNQILAMIGLKNVGGLQHHLMQLWKKGYLLSPKKGERQWLIK